MTVTDLILRDNLELKEQRRKLNEKIEELERDKVKLEWLEKLLRSREYVFVTSIVQAIDEMRGDK